MKKIASIISIVLLVAGIGLTLGLASASTCGNHCPTGNCATSGGCQACCGANCAACCA
ncbi:MAG: hypothetical protein WB392_04815 [Methanotrichaceae archaeon]